MENCIPASCCGSESEGSFFGRRYYSRDEKREWLKGYLGELESELKAVKERIKALEED